MKNSDMDWEKAKNIPVPEYNWRNGSPIEFYETYVKRPHPVILRGFMKGTELMDLTFDNLMDKFGDDEVVLTSKKDGGRYGKLTDVNNPDSYLQNSEALFNKHPGKDDRKKMKLIAFKNRNKIPLLLNYVNLTCFLLSQSCGTFSRQRDLNPMQT